MDNRRSHTKNRSRAERADKSAAARPPRQPRRTLIAGLLWITFMLFVWFQAPGVRLPTFFQRLVGVAHALLSMLVVMFAIREYGKRFNRISLPGLGRIHTSRIAGGLVFLAVIAWWFSSWAPIPAGQPEPDLWGMLEQSLDAPLLQVVDTNLATLLPPVPSAEARQAAKGFAANADPLRNALVAIASSKFDDAAALLENVPAHSGADLAAQARAQLDVYRGNYAAASRRYAAMLKIEPRREDFLAHGALCAALAGDYSTAGAWATQLLEQAQARGRASTRSVEAANLLSAVHLLAGDYADAQRTAKKLSTGHGGRTLLPHDSSDAARAQDAAAANNAAAIRLLTGSGTSGTQSPSSGFASAKEIWLARRTAADPCVAVARSNIAMAALEEERYDQADMLLAESIAAWRQFAHPPARISLAINLNASARLDRTEGRFDRAESPAHEAANLFANGSPARISTADPSLFASQCMIAQLAADRGRYDHAIASLQQVIHDAELGHRGLLPRHPYVAILKLRLAGVFVRAGRNADAESTAGEALAILDRAGLKASRSAADGLRISGLTALRLGDRAEAARQFDRAMKILRPTDEAHPMQQPSLALAQLFAAEGELAGDLQNYADAAGDYHQALSQLADLFENQAANHPLRAEYLHALAMLSVRQDKPAKAKPLLEESLAIDRRALGPNHPSTIAAMNDLASILEKTGSKEAAEKLRAEAKQLHGQ